MKCILGTKLSMTQVFRPDGETVAVTKIKAGPCVVTQIKSKEKDAANSIQIGFETKKPHRVLNAQKGRYKNLEFMPAFVRDFSFGTEKHAIKINDLITVETFEAGDHVDVVGVSKGRGFQGVVKRHGFSGSPASHGHKDQLRMPGSIGATNPQRVVKGKRMAGHMGDAQVTVKNLKIIEVHPETNELWIQGAVPGAKGSLVKIIMRDGILKVADKNSTEAESTKTVSSEIEVTPSVQSQTE